MANNMSDFYDNLDLKYPEIGIAIDRIDRVNPGKVRFIIPILTPNMDNSKKTETKIYQNSSNLMNANKNLEVDNLEVSNYIRIPIPKELCATINGEFAIEGGNVYTEGVSSLISNAHQSGRGDVTETTYKTEGSISVNGSVTGALTFSNGRITGTVKITPTTDRYIEPGSKWVIMFIGGDITRPKVICRYAEDE